MGVVFPQKHYILWYVAFATKKPLKLGIPILRGLNVA